MNISSLASFIAEMIFAEKDTILEALERGDEETLKNDIYYCLESCAEEGGNYEELRP